jgi:S-formylglutathione hydrolase FrmB
MSKLELFSPPSNPSPQFDVLEGAPSFAPSAKGGLLRSNATHLLSFRSFFRLPSNSQTTPKKITRHPEPAPLAGEGPQPKIPATKLTAPSTNLSSRPEWPAFSLVRAERTPATQRRDRGNLSASWLPLRVANHGTRVTLFFLLSLLSLPLLAAPGRVECNSIPSKILSRSVPYCIVLPDNFDSDKTAKYPILYSLHGLGDNEQFFVHSGLWNLVEDMRDKKELKEFLIVTPDGDAGFYINSRDGKNRYEDFLLQEFFPYIEKRYRAAPGRANRAISGVSMGGYGALHLAFSHPQLFGSVSAHSAALIEKLPSFLGTSSSSPRARVLGSVFGNPPDPAFWDRNSPLVLARTANLSALKIYFDCGDQDDYGFESGATALDKILTSRHIPHEFHLFPGRHDPSYFSDHLPASLQFHSNLFP